VTRYPYKKYGSSKDLLKGLTQIKKKKKFFYSLLDSIMLQVESIFCNVKKNVQTLLMFFIVENNLKPRVG
jgi:hypothetical protein